MQTNDGNWWSLSWNVAPGCTKVSDACQNCWAEVMARRLQGMNKPGYEGLVNEHGRWSGKVNLLENRLDSVLHLQRPRVIAVNLMGDLFHPNVPEDFIKKVFLIMTAAYWHTFMVLTKRPERAVEVFKTIGQKPLKHIWFGATAENQSSTNKRWSSMAWMAQEGWKTWVSSEPRLEMINWHGWEFLKVLASGGETGPYARPMNPNWMRYARHYPGP